MNPGRQTAGAARHGGERDDAGAVVSPPRTASTKGGFAGASAGKVGMWIFLASDAMGFAGLLLSYAMLRVRAQAWPDPATRFDRPLAAVLTFVLLFSGASMTAAVAMARAGHRRAARLLLWLTAGAGLAFVVGQGVEFQALASARQLGLTADHAAAIFYVITGYHGLHVLVGAGVLAMLAVQTGGPHQVGETAVTSDEVVRLEVASLYWQFVDVVWMVIFTVLYLLPVPFG